MASRNGDPLSTYSTQSPVKLRLHKKHYLNEVVRERVDFRREKSVPDDFSSISSIGVIAYTQGSTGNGDLLLSLNSLKPLQSLGVKKAVPIPLEPGVTQESTFFDDSQVDSACSTALQAVDSVREESEEDSGSKSDLLQFVTECFSEDRVKQLQDQPRTVKKSRIKLTCRVLNAKNLTLKDTTNPTEFYCELGVLSESCHDKDVTKQKKNVKEWLKEKLIESSGRTSIKLETLEPDWNEVVELYSCKPRKETLVLEIWNGEETGGISTRNRSFVGRCFLPLLHIPTAGVKKKLTVLSHSGKSERGVVTVKLNIHQEKCLADHSELTCAVVNACAKETDGYIRRWDGQLTPVAGRLLELHAATNDIGQLCQACIRLSVMIKYHKLYAVEMSAICDLLKDIKHHTSLSTISPPIPQDYWVKLLVDLNELNDELEGVMKNHLHMFNFDLETALDKLEQCVQTLCQLYSFEPFVEELPPDCRSLKEMCEKCILVAVPKWFRLQEAQALPKVHTEDDNLTVFRDLSHACLHYCQIAHQNLGPMFTQTGIDYFSLFYKVLDPLVGKAVETRMKEYKTSTNAVTYEIYLNYQDMARMVKYVDTSDHNPLYGLSATLLLPQSYKWFQGMVEHWITLAAERCDELTTKAIEADDTIAVTKQVKFSTSAVDVTGFLLKLGNFWKNLEWPDPIAAYGFASTVMEEINRRAQFYVQEVAKRLKHEHIFDQQGRFQASEKLCIVLNNMQHVRQELSHLEERLEFKKFYIWLDTEGEPSLGTRCKDTVQKLLSSADEDISSRMSKIMYEIIAKLSPDIRAFVQNIVSDSKTATAEGEGDIEAITPLMDYLTKNLQTFANDLFPEVLEIILSTLWQLSLDCVHKRLASVQLKKGSDSALLHTRSFTLLNALKDFYHGDGNGLDEAALKTNLYSILHSQLEVLRLPTDKLILRFLSELLEFQRQQFDRERPLGTLEINLSYNKEESAVEVTVLKGEKFPISNKNGSFVQLSVSPPAAFANSKGLFITSTQKKTADPIYDQLFKIPATVSDLDKKGAVLLLSVFEHGTMGTDQFTGMCVVACKDVPHTASDPAKIENLTLPLFRLTEMTISLAEIEARVNIGDNKACAFKGNIKKLLSFLPRPRARSRSRSRGSSVSNLEDLQAQPVSLPSP